MALRSVKSESRAFFRDSSMIEEHAKALYNGKPTLCSMRDYKRLVNESKRAREAVPIHPVRQTRPRDFTANFQGSLTSNPNYAASHTSPEPLTRRKVIPTYPVTQSLRWNPYVETSSFEEITNTCVDNKPCHQCRCSSCTSRNCRSKKMSYSSDESWDTKGANIIKFADIYTMTPKVADIGCGSSLLLTYRASGVSANIPTVAVRDKQIEPRRASWRPILKNSRRLCDYNDSRVNASCGTNERLPLVICDSDQSVSDDVPRGAYSVKSYFRWNKKSNDRKLECKESSRRVVYNEGITDRVQNQWPLVPMYVPSISDVRRYSCLGCGRSKTLLSRPIEPVENPIPHSHRHNSRYHEHCNTSSKSNVYRIIPPKIPKVMPKKSFSKMTTVNFRSPCINLPRKLITSNSNIDSFVNKNCNENGRVYY